MQHPLHAAEAPASPRWSGPEFTARVTAFVEDAVGPANVRLDKLRGWSAVWRAESAGGEVFWAKVNCAPNAVEAALLAALGDLVPGRVVPVLAREPDGLMLLPDQGPVLGAPHDDLGSWCRILAEWGSLQRDLLEHTDLLRGLGVAEVSLEDCLPMLEERAGSLHALSEDDPMRLGDAEHHALRVALPVVRRIVGESRALGLPVALNHNDLHGDNVFTHGAAEEPLRFFDLGDAMLTDPTSVLLVPLRVLADRLGAAAGDRRLWRVADAWIEVWSDVVPATQIRRALPRALRLGHLPRHDSWLRATVAMTAAERDEWGIAPAHHLAAVARTGVLGE